MNPQPTLPLDAPEPRRTRRGCGRRGGPHENSARAYREVGARGLGRAQRRVLALIASMEPCTDNQLVRAWTQNGGEANTPRPRRVELEAMRLVEYVGDAGGRSLWSLTPLGREWLAKGVER